MGDETLGLLDEVATKTRRGGRALVIAQNHPVHRQPRLNARQEGRNDSGP